MTIFVAKGNALAFVGTNYTFGKRCHSVAEEELEQHDLAVERLQKAKDQQDEDRMEQLDIINQRLSQKNEVKT